MIAIITIALFAAGIIYLQQRLIDKLQREKSELLDRLFVSKGLPPQGVDVKAIHEKREEKKSQAKTDNLPRADPITHARHRLIADEQKQLGRSG